MATREIRAALEYHERTKHSEERLQRERFALDWPNQPLPFKIYEDLEPIPLVGEYPSRSLSVFESIAAPVAPRGIGAPESIPDLSTLSRVLHLSAGITKRVRRPGGEHYFRAYSNTGALYHVDLYLATADLPGLPAGVYHFGPHDFALRRLRAGDFRATVAEASGANPEILHAPVVIASASTFWRNAWKYRERAWRHCFWDAGTLHANLLAVAGGEALAPHVVLGYADRALEHLLGLDPAREGSLALVPLGHVRGSVPAAPPAPALHLATRALSRAEVDYPAIRIAHAASSLEDGAEAAAWRGAAPLRAEPAARGTLVPLRPIPAPSLAVDPLERVIRRRGSTRAFDPQRSLAFEELSTALQAATCAIPADFLGPTSASLSDLYVIAHAVEGLAPGAYHLRRGEGSLELLKEGTFRDQAGYLGLGQQLPADAAANVYCLADLTRVLARFGNRGYRAAQLEGGIIGGRLYLAAYALRFGATGLTFFDDAVTEFLSPHAAGKAVLFLTALGHANRARLGLA